MRYEPGIRQRAISGVRDGLWFALIYSAYASVLFLVRGAKPFEHVGLSLPVVVALYFAGGIMSGAIYGALSPWGRTLVGRVGLVWVAMIPSATLIGMSIIPPGQWRSDLLPVTALSVGILGTILGVVIWYRGRGKWTPPTPV